MSGSGELRMSLFGVVMVNLDQFAPVEFCRHLTIPMILQLFDILREIF